MRRWGLAAVIPCLLLTSIEAFAWGPEGHAIIAEIAAARLTPAASAAVTKLLAQEGHRHLDEVASWADAVRPARPDTGRWHFVNIPLDASGYDPARDCPDDACVVAQIRIDVANLQNHTGDQLETLKFLVHFVGDIHQPLHCENDDDRGGNAIHISYFGKRTNFHAVWDEGIIERALHVSLGPNYTPDFDATRMEATTLTRRIGEDEGRVWAPADLAARIDIAAAQWANESHALAQNAYDQLPELYSRRGTAAFQKREWPVVEQQLARAGVRLAELLNEVMR